MMMSEIICGMAGLLDDQKIGRQANFLTLKRTIKFSPTRLGICACERVRLD